MNFLKNVLRFLIKPGYQALTLHKLSKWFYQKNMNQVSKIIMRVNRFLTAIEIEPGAVISDNVKISHGVGIVIGNDAVIDENVLIRQNVTIGQHGLSECNGDRLHPHINKNVSIGAGAVILGPITIGENVVIGANAVITKSVPPNAVVAGVPGKILRYIEPEPKTFK